MFKKIILFIILIASLTTISYSLEVINNKPNINIKTQQQVYIFTATWCGPCKIVKKYVLSDNRVKKVFKKYDIKYIDIDRSKSIKKQWRVSSIPTIGISKKNNDKLIILGKWQPSGISSSNRASHEKNIKSLLKFLSTHSPKKP